MSTSPLQKYTTKLIVTGVALAVVSSLGQFYLRPVYVHPLWFILLLFVAGVQWLAFAFVLKFAQHKTQTLLRQYQVAKYAKLFIYMIVMIGYVFSTNRELSLPFLIDFIVYYAVFTGLEMYAFHRWMNTLPTTKRQAIKPAVISARG